MRVTAQKLLLFLFLPYYTYSQYEVIGVVKDSTNNPIEFANVVLTNELNKIVVGTITNKEGQFKLSTRKGDYKLVTLSYLCFLIHLFCNIVQLFKFI
ncbi:carboxypeptidase-like regulatory domain-containing protein [Snuella lapsa]|uniref:Carboxypeptidase regulatory-like domain-containing protein n=1 Tax=Snuella lapsa TaxID=870481 RepID=A0ABP6XSK0_9FLAO